MALGGGIWAKTQQRDQDAFTQITADGKLYTVYTVNLKTDHLQLHWKNPNTQQPYFRFKELRQQLRKEGKKMLFATNSGIFAVGHKPLGLHIEKGKQIVAVNKARYGGNFALLPNGIFWIKGQKAGVTETWTYLKHNPQPTFATQSGPLLVSNGKLHPKFNKNSTSLKTRSGVGVCKDGTVRFVLSAAPVNFYSFAVFFRDKLKCPNALYLDGSLSAFATPKYNTQLFDFAGIWSVSR